MPNEPQIDWWSDIIILTLASFKDSNLLDIWILIVFQTFTIEFIKKHRRLIKAWPFYFTIYLTI